MKYIFNKISELELLLNIYMLSMYIYVMYACYVCIFIYNK